MLVSLFSLYLEYSASGRIADEKYIEICANIMASYMKVQDYLTDIDVIDDFSKNERSVAGYNSELKSMLIFTKGIEKFCKDKFFNSKMSDIEKVYVYNAELIRIINHEFEHTNQYKKIDTSDDLEAKILRNGSSLLTNKQKSILLNSGCAKEELEELKIKRYDIYKSIYNKTAEERLADHYSYLLVCQLVDNLKGGLPGVYKFFNGNRLFNSIDGYIDEDSFTVSPAIDTFKLYGNEESLNEFDWYSENKEKTLVKVMNKHSLDERIKYGLPITGNEFRVSRNKHTLI